MVPNGQTPGVCVHYNLTIVMYTCIFHVPCVYNHVQVVCTPTCFAVHWSCTLIESECCLSTVLVAMVDGLAPAFPLAQIKFVLFGYWKLQSWNGFQCIFK